MAQGPLTIGWARGDITPPGKTLLQGQFHARLAEATLSPLTATALALEVRGGDGVREQAVFLSCDLVNDDFKQDLLAALEERCDGFDSRKLTVNCTHTHTAPAMTRGKYPEPENEPGFIDPDAYRAWLADRLAGIVETAWNGRRPGSLSRGFGYAVVGRCRRAVYADGSAMMYGETDRNDFLGFESCDDHAVNMLFTRSPEGELTGLLVNLACPAQCQENLTRYSSDFWHDVRVAVAGRFGEGVHLLPQVAPAGDLSPHLLADRKEEKDLRDRLGVNGAGIIARRILAAVEEGLATASPAQDRVELVHEVYTLHLPRLLVTEADVALEKRMLALSPDERKRLPFGFQRIWPFGLVCDPIARYARQSEHPTHEVEMHVIRLGDVAFATNPFELFVDYGMRIRCRSRALQTFLVELADGSDLGVYLPTQRALDGGHYSALIKSNWVGPEGGRMLVDETVAAINRLFAGESFPTTR